MGLDKEFWWSWCDPGNLEVELRIWIKSGNEILRGQSRLKLTRFWVGCLEGGLELLSAKRMSPGDCGLGSPSIQTGVIWLRVGHWGPGSATVQSDEGPQVSPASRLG